MSEPTDLYELLRKIRYDTTAIQAKLTDAFNLLAELQLPDQANTVCPSCGLKNRGPNTLAEHLYTSHNGPLPAHWTKAEARAHDPDQELTQTTLDAATPDTANSTPNR